MTPEHSSSASAVRIGVDLGGTKIEAVALDRAGAIRFRQRIPTPGADYAAIVRAVAALVAAADSAVESLTPRGSASVGIGIPGTVSPATGLVKNANTTCLIGHALDKDLAAAVGRSVRLANDADCFALSEATDGAGAGFATVWGVILGTGTGSGLVVRGQLVRGPNAITGEWGHNPLPWPAADETPGPLCYCGQHGCTETFLSGPALSREYKTVTGVDIAATEIAARAASEPKAKAIFARYLDRMARATATIINLFDPDVIVLGGGLSQIGALYTDLPPLWPDYVFSDTVVTPIRPPKHGDSSGVRGAAWLWP